MGIRESQWIGTLGGLLVAAGIILNPWLLQFYFGEAGTGKFVANLILQALLLGGGALLINYRNKLRLAELCLVLVSAVLSLGVAEWVLRYTDNTEDEFKVFRANPHATGSYRLLPDLDFNFVAEVNRQAMSYEIQTNSHGMRWREVSRHKPAGIKRIAFLGDSFTFGESADKVENSFAGVFESLLASRHYEVLNFGVDGYGIDDSALYLEEEIIGFDPDYCFLMFFNGNDFRDTYLGLNKFDISSGTAQWNPGVIEQKIPRGLRGGKFSSIQPAKPSLLESSKLFVALRSLWRSLRAETPSIESIDPSSYTIEEQFTAFNYWTKADYDGLMLQARDTVFTELARIKRFTQAHGIELVIVAIPMEEQVYAATWQGEDPQGKAFDIRKPQAYVEQFARDNAIPYLDLLPHLRHHLATTGKDLYPHARQKGGDIHFNNEGHAVTGRLLVDFFQTRIATGNAQVAR